MHSDLHERNFNRDMSLETWMIEDRADLVALELLAPKDIVISCARKLPSRYLDRQKTLLRLLIEDFGLPERIADVYAVTLLLGIGEGTSLAGSLLLAK